MKRVLLISYYFPPDNAVGGLRIAKFARYLPSSGWKPYVLTTADRFREGLDPLRLNDVKDVEVFKATELPSLRSVYLKLKAFALSVGGKKRIGVNELKQSAASGRDRPAIGDEGVFRRLKRRFISLFVLLPDDKRGWVIPAALNAVRRVGSEKIDCIITSGPPHSIHIAGLIVRKMTGVKWVADFRDPWVDVLEFKSPRARSRLSDGIERWLEKKVVESSDRVLTTTKALKEIFADRYNREPSVKFLHLPNAIDFKKFPGGAAEKYGQFTITHLGTLYAGRTPEPVFEAVRGLITDGKISPADIKLKLIGNCEFIEGVSTQDAVRSCGLEGLVEVAKPIPYVDALKVMCSSHLLLLLAPGLPLQIPAKVYDYMGSGTRVLGLCPEKSATAELLGSTGCGMAFDPSDIAGIAGYIHELFEKYKRGELKGGAGDYARYSADALTQRLAEELNSIARF